jgi:hypothetical protein
MVTTKHRQPSVWWARVVFVRRKRTAGYVVKAGRKLGGLSFTEYQSRPLPDRRQADLFARTVERAFEEGKPVRPVTWWQWHVIPRRVKAGTKTKEVWVGTVRKWINDGSFVWREISPCDTREEAERIAVQSMEAGQALEVRR